MLLSNWGNISVYLESAKVWKGSWGSFQPTAAHFLCGNSLRALNIFVSSWLPLSEGHPAESCLCYCGNKEQQLARCSKNCDLKDVVYLGREFDKRKISKGGGKISQICAAFCQPCFSYVVLRINNVSAPWWKAFATGHSMCLKYHRIRYIPFLLASPIMYWPPPLSLYIKSVWKAQKYSRGMPIPQGLADIVRKKHCQKLVSVFTLLLDSAFISMHS